MAGNHSIEAIGQIAPLSLIELKHALDSASIGAEVELLSDDPLMEEDIARYLLACGDASPDALGHELLGSVEEGAARRFRIRKGGSPQTGQPD